jgi:hypothetical protein
MDSVKYIGGWPTLAVFARVGLSLPCPRARWRHYRAAPTVRITNRYNYSLDSIPVSCILFLFPVTGRRRGR